MVTIHDIPMTTATVQGLGLTESDTCSWHCCKCEGRVWFIGDLQKVSLMPHCPYCGRVTVNECRKAIEERDEENK